MKLTFTSVSPVLLIAIVRKCLNRGTAYTIDRNDIKKKLTIEQEIKLIRFYLLDIAVKGNNIDLIRSNNF